ncbi:MAG: YceH family protein [Acidobacteriota bacterium]|nr:YceH family protein [Acidobacteriota bacterium]
MTIHLNDAETRVLGSLIEKDITTPDYYPLSLNALVNACNQKNNRDPVTTLDADVVRDALDTLHDKNLAGPTSSADSRVTKYEHRMQEAFNFTRGETAILCVLLLRGPQTPGELRGRSERMHHFEHLDEVQSTLQRLMQREPPLARVLPRQPGTKESRYMQLLSGDIGIAASPPSSSTAGRTSPENYADHQRMSHLENEVEVLKKEVADLKQQLATFRKQSD